MALFGPSDAVVQALTNAVSGASLQVAKLVAASQADTAQDIERADLLREIQAEYHADQQALRQLIRDAVGTTTRNLQTALDFLVGMRNDLRTALEQHTQAIDAHAETVRINSSAHLHVARELENLNTILRQAQQPVAQPRLEFHVGPVREQ